MARPTGATKNAMARACRQGWECKVSPRSNSPMSPAWCHRANTFPSTPITIRATPNHSENPKDRI